MAVQKAVYGVLLVRSGNVSANGTMPRKIVNLPGIATVKRDKTPLYALGPGRKTYVSIINSVDFCHDSVEFE